MSKRSFFVALAAVMNDMTLGKKRDRKLLKQIVNPPT